MEVNQKFHLQGDVMKNSARLVPDLLNAGIRVLAYVGNTGAHFPSRLIELSYEDLI